MIVKECMTEAVELANPDMTLQEAAKKMKDGDFGSLPVGENDRLIGVITDRDIMSEGILYCYEDQTIEEVARNMGDIQVRRLPVLNREKRLVGILSLGDIALERNGADEAEEALSQISRHQHGEVEARERAQK